MSRERERFDEIGKKIKRGSYYYSDASSSSCNQQVGRRYMVGGSGGTLNTVTPCAACKLLRRRCAQECPFSPYFSPHEPHKFASVHKVFGASNVSKLLMEVPESQRADAANSLVYEARVRLRDPVYGCMGAILALQQQVQSLQAELDVVRSETRKYNHSALLSSGVVSVAGAAPPSQPPPPPPPPPPLPLITSSSSSLYTPVLSTATHYSNISNNIVPYFG